MSRKQWPSDKLFFRLLHNKSKRTYWDNIQELRQRPSDKVYNKAVQLCYSDTQKEQIIGIDILAQLGGNPRFRQEEILSLYYQLLDLELSPKVLASILSGIGHNNTNLSDNQIVKLISFQEHSYSGVRFSLVHALMGLENRLSINSLIALSKDKHKDIREWATFAIGSQIEATNEGILKAPKINEKWLVACLGNLKKTQI